MPKSRSSAFLLVTRMLLGLMSRWMTRFDARTPPRRTRPEDRSAPRATARAAAEAVDRHALDEVHHEVRQAASVGRRRAGRDVRMIERGDLPLDPEAPQVPLRVDPAGRLTSFKATRCSNWPSTPLGDPDPLPCRPGRAPLQRVGADGSPRSRQLGDLGSGGDGVRRRRSGRPPLPRRRRPDCSRRAEGLAGCEVERAGRSDEEARARPPGSP